MLHAAETKQEFAIGLAPEFFKLEPEGATAMLWLIYAEYRMEYAESHARSVVIRDGRVAPSFEDETTARRRTVEMLKRMRNQKPSLSDPYWDAIEKVVDSGFIQEYVWEYIRQRDWPADAAPKRLTEFQTYRAKELKDHVVVTLASVIKN